MNIVRYYMHAIRPHYHTFIAAEEAHARFDEINSSEVFKTRTRYSSPVRSFSFLKMTHCVNTDEQHERI